MYRLYGYAYDNIYARLFKLRFKVSTEKQDECDKKLFGCQTLHIKSLCTVKLKHPSRVTKSKTYFYVNRPMSHRCSGCHSPVQQRRACTQRSTALSAVWDWECRAAGQRRRDPTPVAGRNELSERHRHPEKPNMGKIMRKLER